MSTHVVVLGAGFGGLELTSRLVDALGSEVEVTLIDKNEAFVFGFSKFELMLGRDTLEGVRSYYRDIVKPGVTFRRETVTAIDAAARRVTTNAGSYEADYLVIALGADYDIAATPGLAEGGHEFYSVDGALRLKGVLPAFRSGDLVVAVLGEPFKCPPAPCEAVMLLDEFYRAQGTRQDITITLVHPWGVPIPPSPGASGAIRERFAELGITFMGQQLVTGIDPATNTARLRDGGTLRYDLFLGIPIHRAPEVVRASGLAPDGWIPVDKVNLETKYPRVYAIGDVNMAPVPRAGVFAESAGRTVAENIVMHVRSGGGAAPYDGAGACYVEFGDGRVGRVDANFLSGPTPVAPFVEPSIEGAEQKKGFAAERRRRWFGKD